MIQLVLASTSKYRQALLLQLGLPFTCMRPLFDEDEAKSKLRELSPKELALALAHGKAKSLARIDRCVIGADQLISFQGKILGKPGSEENCVNQLMRMQNQPHELITAVSIHHGSSMENFVDTTTLKMKALNKQEVDNYVKLDQAFDCAGGYKIERHGIMLFESIDSQDWTAIQGLPLIQLSKCLSRMGLDTLNLQSNR